MSGGDESQSLVDESAIRDLAVRYCTAVDRHDWDLLAKLFLPDATVAVPGADRMRGAGQIMARYRRGLSKYSSTHHLVTNHEIALDGDSARHRCLVRAHHARPDDSGGTAFTIGGRYEDQLVRTPQGWKFKHRELVTAWTEDGAAS